MARRHARTPYWVWPVIVVLVAAVAALTGTLFFGPEAVQRREEAAEAEARAQSRSLEPGRAYYVWVKLIELNEQLPGNEQWDPGKDSAPDIHFELSLNDARLQESEPRYNTFVARWDPISVNVKDLLLDGATKIDPAGLIHVPLVRYDAGTELELNVWDHDASFFPDEAAGRVVLALDDLDAGENVLSPAADGESSIRQLIVVFFPEDLPMADLIQLLSDR
jgi:hypothetical protein